jgi:hypothetical protein
MKIDLEKLKGMGKLNRRRFVALGATAATAACVPGCRNPDNGRGPATRPMRLFFTTHGRTALINADGSGLRYLDFNDQQMPRLPRGCGYWSLLSGCAGYTYGCAGIWNWGIPAMQDDPQETVRDWRTGMNGQSSTEMKHLAGCFGGLEWRKLEPHPELIRNQSGDWIRHMVLAKSPAGDLVVAYLPDNESICVDWRSLPGRIAARWFDPKSGRSAAVQESIRDPDSRTFERPRGWEDAVFILRRKCQSLACQKVSRCSALLPRKSGFASLVGFSFGCLNSHDRSRRSSGGFFARLTVAGYSHDSGIPED